MNGTFTDHPTEATVSRLACAVELLCVRLGDFTVAVEKLADAAGEAADDAPADLPKILSFDGARPPRKGGRG